MERLTRLVDGEMEAATLEHNEAAALKELAAHLRQQLNRVIDRQVVEAFADEDDPTYPEDYHVLSTLPPNSDDDDEQDAKADGSDRA